MAVTTWGDWSFDRRADEIADLAWRGVVVLRSIRAVVRDADWATATPEISRIDEGPDSLTLAVTWTDLGADVAGDVTVRADGDVVSVTFDAESRAAFRTNRVGLVVLHPHRLAGVPLRVVHAGGGQESTAFPRAVSPHQPVFDIAGLAWAVDGVEVDLAFGGDVFEMEDQRNWTDASYKTYSRPLDLPFPYDLAAGERVAQSVTVRAAGAATAVGARGADRIELRAEGTFPDIVVGAASAPEPAPHEVTSEALLVELDLSATNWRAALARAAGTAAALDVRLIAPPTADAPWGTKTPGAVTGAELEAALGSAVRELVGLPVRRVGVFDPVSHLSEPALVAALRVALADAALSPALVGGTRSHFTELNREQERVPADVDAVAFGLTPLFHTLGDEQLFESIAVQRALAAQAVEIAGDRPVHVGPVTLRARFNNVATRREPAPVRDDLSDGYGAEFTGSPDPRQTSAELAAWTIASAAALAVPGVAGIAYFEEWGARGIRSADGDPYPVAAAVDALRSLSGARLLWGASPDTLVWAVGARDAAATALLMANLDTRPRMLSVVVDGTAAVEALVPARSWRRVRGPV
ncbi:hypothetical protein ABC304_06075 [Microbacterium sp. 1P10UB]|uniref:hypothetical protein n=1 Tax=unclassified Microbacterium TaxID=2609290 RepID=UPI0039A24E3F